MKLSYEKKYLIKHIETVVLDRLKNELKEAEDVIAKSILKYEQASTWHRFWVKHPDAEPYGNDFINRIICSGCKTKLEKAQKMLATLKNDQLLDTVILDNDEINLLGL